jgi:hypothetical protein
MIWLAGLAVHNGAICTQPVQAINRIDSALFFMVTLRAKLLKQ